MSLLKTILYIYHKTSFKQNDYFEVQSKMSLRGGQRPMKQSFENGSGQTQQSHEIVSLSLAMTGY